MKSPPVEIGERLLAEFGRQPSVLGISINDAAVLTGIPRSTLYYYFRGSDDLAVYLLRPRLERLQSEVARAAHGDGAAVDRLEATMRSFVEGLSQHPALCTDLLVVLHRLEGAAGQMPVAQHAVLGTLRELLIEARATGDLVDVAPELAGAAIVGSLIQAAMAQVSISGQVDVDELAEQVVQLLLRGLIVNRTGGSTQPEH